MSTSSKTPARRGLWSGALAALALAAVIAQQAFGAAVANFLTAKSLPDATVAVIDPESGTSTGTSGSDVLLAAGDIILFRFAYSPAPENAIRGVNGYLTEYVPPGTQVVGVRFLDKNGLTVPPRPTGLAVRGCAGGAACGSFASVPCPTGTCNFNTTPGAGSVSQVYADTGVFYSNDARTAPAPGNLFLSLSNGLDMTAFEPRGIAPEITQLINAKSPPYRAHNDWDWDQVRAFGGQTSPVSGGIGNLPFGYGSPVAGPHSFYRFEATDTGTRLELAGVVGPWRRIRTPGGRIGTGVANLGDTNLLERSSVLATGGNLGDDVTPATPATANAVRWASGETRVGTPAFVEVALRVLQVPIDPTFGTGAGNVNCGEVFGSDISGKSANTGGSNHPWRTYIASPQCVFLRLKYDLTVDKDVAAVGANLNYALFGKNLALTTETGVVATVAYVESDQSFVSAVPAPTSSATCPPPDTNKTCLRWNLGALAPSDEIAINLVLAVQGQGGGTNVVTATYTSNELTAIDAAGFSTTAVTVVQPVADPRITLAPTVDPTTGFAAAGTSTYQLQGTFSNAGTTSWGQDSVTLTLPAGWTATTGQFRIAGTVRTCSSNCATSTPTFAGLGLSYAPAQSRAWDVRVTIPAGQAAGLYPIDVATEGSQSVFGSFETFEPELAVVPVGAVRSQPPVLACPIGSTSTSVTGTAEPSAAVRLLFNLIPRGTGTASGAGAFSITNFLPAFGELYGGLEVRATAQAPGELESLPSVPCTVESRRQCNDGLDNDGDGQVDFPADPGCDSINDGSEVNPATPQCSDGVDNNGAGGIDWPLDPTCSHPLDPTEGGAPQCADGVDNDGDGQTDLVDGNCTGPTDATEFPVRQCQDGLDNDGDGRVDFGGRAPFLPDPGCHSAFDDLELDTGSTSADLKARLLVVVDSSGSMNWNTCADDFTGGDGSSECPGADVACASCGAGVCGNASADDSRLFQVKAGLSNVVAAFGDVEYSLMRFHQREIAFGCPTAAAGQKSGGWQGGGAAPCSGGFAAGDLLVSFADNNEETILTWMNHDSDSTGTPQLGTDWEIRGSGTTPLAGALTSANSYLDGVRAGDLRSACRPYRVILVTDGAETCGGNPVAAAAALRADGAFVSVIGFATPDPTVIANLNAIAAAGSASGTASAIFVDDEAALSAAIAQIISDSVVFERCNNLDDDCDTRVDEDFPDLGAACDNGEDGACLEPGTRVCSSDGAGTVCDAPPGTPSPEVCNSQDDDCDLLVDEGLVGCACAPVAEICNGRDDDCDLAVDEGALPGEGDSCGLGLGECSPGTLQCVAGALDCVGDVGPVDESCNVLDDDCDTFVDEVADPCYEFPTGCSLATGTCAGSCTLGVRGCAPGGGPGACVGDVGPGAEVCNGLDDDCDGTTDEGFDVGATCSNGQSGVCAATGTIVCTPAGGTACTAPTRPPGVETCNALDDDCDTRVDEALGPPIGNACGGGGACTGGTFQCVAGSIECVGSTTGQPELCNGADDDCDTRIDEMVAGTGGTCVPPGFEPFADTGECALGHLECRGGQLDCEGYVGPRPEVPCNGLDEDCDGNDAQTCPGAQACTPQGCANPCTMEEFPCPFGQYCEDVAGGRYCLDDPCADVTCPAGFTCDRADGSCKDLCAGVTCDAGLTCRNGFCLDCFVIGCPSGQVCQLGPSTRGECVVDLCDGVTCGADQFCRSGACVPLVCTPTCADGQRCDEGACVPDLCAEVSCSAGRLCDPATGGCIVDRCVDVSCRQGERCNPADGDCIGDPCLQVDCPVGATCALELDGQATCVRPAPPREDRVLAGGGGGCAAGGDGGGGGAAALALAGLALAGRRRRPGPRRG